MTDNAYKDYLAFTIDNKLPEDAVQLLLNNGTSINDLVALKTKSLSVFGHNV